MSANMLPVGQAVLGRVLNSTGEPIDNKGELHSATRIPSYSSQALAHIRAHMGPKQFLETGIKAIDLMASITYGSIIGTIAGARQGQLVVVEEIMHTLLTRYQSVIVMAGMGEVAYDASMLREMVRDIEAENQVVMLFEQATVALAARQQLLYAALTIAAHFADEGRKVFLVIDSHLMTQENMIYLQNLATTKGITSLGFVPVNDLGQPLDDSLVRTLDVQLQFSATRARRGQWPAIDPLSSRSSFLESAAVSSEHRQIAQRVHALLQRYYELQDRANDAGLSTEDQLVLVRGERINLFFTQPFVVAEAYTDVPGTYVPLEEIITTFGDLLDGRYDTAPVQTFQFVGRIDQI